MALIDNINKDKLPAHIAIVMDGNGRWAKQRGLERVFGHQQGVSSLRQIVEAASDLGIGYLTLYAFSTENWGRPDDEVAALMSLMVQSLNNETETLLKNKIRLKVIGDIERLDKDLRTKLNETIRLTSVGKGLSLVIALSYSSRWEISEASRKIALEALQGRINPDSIDEDLFGEYLTTAGIPDPELLIRTSGERRISNFLLWQLAYSEIVVTNTLWPDFEEKEFLEIIKEYQNRDRRFGKVRE